MLCMMCFSYYMWCLSLVVVSYQWDSLSLSLYFSFSLSLQSPSSSSIKAINIARAFFFCSSVEETEFKIY